MHFGAAFSPVSPLTDPISEEMTMRNTAPRKFAVDGKSSAGALPGSAAPSPSRSFCGRTQAIGFWCHPNPMTAAAFSDRRFGAWPPRSQATCNRSSLRSYATELTDECSEGLARGIFYQRSMKPAAQILRKGFATRASDSLGHGCREDLDRNPSNLSQVDLNARVPVVRFRKRSEERFERTRDEAGRRSIFVSSIFH